MNGTKMFKALIAAAFVIGSTFPGLAQTSAEVERFQRAVTFMEKGDWRTALATAKSVNPVAQDIIEWHRLRAGLGTFQATQSFLEKNGDWPGLKLLRRKSEGRLTLRSDPDDVIAFFATEPPQTGTGARVLIAAYEAKGLKTEALAEAAHTWQTMIITDFDQKALLRQYGDILKQYHEDRLDMLLWRNAQTSAERMYPLVSEGWRAMARQPSDTKGYILSLIHISEPTRPY